jgi:hypothetical protein
MPRHRVGANAPPDDRLRRGIQCAASVSGVSGILDRPVKPGDDIRIMAV